MNDYDQNSLKILVVGPGKEFFDDVYQSESSEFREHDLDLNVSEGFSAPEVTEVLISIGANVVAGLSVYYISKVFDKIFSAKAKAKEQGREMHIHVSISEKLIIKNVESTSEIERSVNFVIETKSGNIQKRS
ncbi:hypothetical protein [Vibrio parahaemolyticus]|uniref:Uncharacterized protein n=1 Tax=Vibrio parahaemolyticus TaxID=670 RepID=A0AA46Z119_VIBPH|nr:hypothetical protein [Vibrio parahaemolyticus]MCC3850308.1 hypothetical protein [Vibrio parahaemolyticus]UYV25313.1 hypothetical protein M5598_09620 [Vibrio parahaemolyticus]HCJ4876929.1 hypothetical protein [Vibrio parahaemolyticus]